jgi:hypothetical protein
MRRTVLALQLALAIAIWAGCTKSHKMAAVSGRDSSASGLIGMDTLTPAASAGYRVALSADLSPEAKRFIAMQHRLAVVSSETDLPKNWDTVIQFCGTIRCEVISSSIVARTRESFPSGAITLRVAPEDFPKLLTQIETQGNIVQHTTLSEDKTTQVVDTEARLKNLTTYRDQSNLDSDTAKRRILANETEKVAVEIEFKVRDANRRRSPFAPLWSALGEAGETLAQSLASVVTFVVFVIPWILLFVLIGWFLRRFWRKRRERKTALAAAQTGS